MSDHTRWMYKGLTGKLQVAGKLFEAAAVQIASVALQPVDAGLQYLAITNCCLSTCIHPLRPESISINMSMWKIHKNYIPIAKEMISYARCSTASSSKLPDLMLPTSTRSGMRWEGETRQVRLWSVKEMKQDL